MVEPTNFTSGHQKQHGQTSIDFVGRTLKTKIKQLTDQIHAKREESIKENLQRQWKHLEHLFSMVEPIVVGRESLQNKKNVINMLSLRINNPLCKFNDFPKGMIEKDDINNVEISSTKSIRISPMKKLPPYTSWVYVARNVRMAIDQSVIGKIQIYHDTKRGETVICSDNEEEIVNFEDFEHDFTEAEDQILRMAIEEYGSPEEVLSIVKEIVKTTNLQIQERYKKLKEKNMSSPNCNCEDCDCRGCEKLLKICLEKNLNTTLESFDNIFCRQCLIFDCPVHGISQHLIYHSEKQSVWSGLEGNKKPCSDQCYILIKDVRNSSKNLAQGSFEYRPVEEDSALPPNKSSNSSDEESRTIYHTSLKTIIEHTSKTLTISGSCDHGERGKGVIIGQKDLTNEVKDDEMTSNSIWKPLEKDLFLKGKEMFGKNSCLITSNLLPGLKTCLEVARYMFDSGESTCHGSIPSSIVDINEKINAEYTDQEMLSKSRSQRKKGKPKKFTNSRKSAGLPPSWRRIANGKTLRNKQYTPCGCRGACGKQCPCLLVKTCCEKYCGCVKVCNNRFRGCYCVKSQCRTRLCPCFAANRECDPDVCRYCWVSCGDGSLGEPPRHGEGQCGNMNILLGQKERILLAKSHVAGWGVFAKNSVNKNACLGEYTGELIAQDEADKRGKLYIRINNSYLFNLNDEWVIDARRLGNKLKFANHSSKPNCYIKVTLVGGDHRVGIFAKENIEAGEELLYDYFYDLDCAPLWALPPKAKASKKNESSISKGKAKKHQSQ